jgi:hypothetical protein
MRLASWLAAVMACSLAQGQTIDDVAMLVQGRDTIARVTFNGNVRFVQRTPNLPSELFRISFQMIAADEAVLNQSTEEAKRFPGGGTLPEFSLTYSPKPGQRAKQLILQLQHKVVVQVRQGPSPRSIDIVFPGLRSAAPATAGKRFGVLLQSMPSTEADKLPPVPIQFQNYEVFSVNTVVDGVEMLETTVGYFATEAEADAALQIAQRRFPQARVVELGKRGGSTDPGRSDAPVVAAAAAASGAAQPPAPAPALAAAPDVPAGQAAPDTPAPPAQASPATAMAPAPSGAEAKPEPATELDRQAEALMVRAREAIAAKNYPEATGALNRLLLLPPNMFSQEAQELIGVAWERAGEPVKARMEYELYLKLFPEGEGSQRVGQRLADLEGGTATRPPGSAPLVEPGGSSAKPAEPPKRFSGNIAQYYYGGKAKSQSLVNIATGIDQSTLSKTTESAIVTNVDLGGRFDTPDSETRVVLRGTGSVNLVSTSHSESLLNAAYVDYKRSELAVRAGRQTPIGGGLLGLFDGVSLTYPVAEKFKFDLMGGVPANVLVSAPSQRLLAAVLEADGIFDRWGGNVYVIDQTSEGITNRRGLGGEVRYSGEQSSLYALLDYDTKLRKLNAASVQSSFQMPGQTTVTMLLDERKAPALQLTNALISAAGDPAWVPPGAPLSLKTLLQGHSLAEVQERALLTTATARQGLVSVSRPVSEQWQLSMDLRYSAIGAIPKVGTFEATPATGAQYGFSTQLTGSNLYSKRDINSFNFNVLTTPLFKGVQVSYNNLTALQENTVTVEPSISLYGQHDNQGVKLQRITPGLRLTYRMSRRTSLLGESVFEHSTTDGPGVNRGTSNSAFFYFGYRYELF